MQKARPLTVVPGGRSLVKKVSAVFTGISYVSEALHPAFSNVQESLDTTSIPGSEASPAERAGVLTFSGSIFLEGGIHEFCADDHEVAPQIQIPKAATRKGRKKLATKCEQLLYSCIVDQH